MSAGFACLVIADESPEFPAALTYAAILAKNAGWRLIMLRVLEPSDPAPWASISEEMRRQAQAAAESLTQRFCAEAWAECGVTPEPIIMEGELRPEVRKLIETDASIKLVILASERGPGGPGVLVSALAKGHGLGARPVPVVVVPGWLSKEEVRALALPVPSDPMPPPA